jgi:curved DNA-binding protein CbpA
VVQGEIDGFWGIRMNDFPNRDLYEVLEISPNASQETIERMFRFLAQRYHPDRQGTGNAERFDQVVKAYNMLKEPESRATYDSSHKTNLDYQWSLFEEAGDSDNFHGDSIIQERVLSVLYTKRKRDPSEPGLRPLQLERLTGCPHEMLEFHLWYLRDKGWIMRMEDGSVAITASGVDQSLLLHGRDGTQKLITEQSAA